MVRLWIAWHTTNRTVTPLRVGMSRGSRGQTLNSVLATPQYPEETALCFEAETFRTRGSVLLRHSVLFLESTEWYSLELLPCDFYTSLRLPTRVALRLKPGLLFLK